MKKIVAAIVVVALGVGFLGYTKSGRQMLNVLGFATACEGGGCS